MADRVRHPSSRGVRAPYSRDFVNPLPSIPGTDARVWIELSNRRIPFAYRWFNADNPYIKQLLPGWAPEFTLKDYKIVILVYGTFFGQIPGVIQQDVLAKVILEQAGWKVLSWWEFDITTRLDQLFAQVPELNRPAIHGGMYASPYGIPDLMARFRELRARQRRYINTNPIGRSRNPDRRQRSRAGAFRVGRVKRDIGREHPTRRRYPRPRRYSRAR